MVGQFHRFHNHQGELRWKFERAYRVPPIDSAKVLQISYPEIRVFCNIKRSPRVGTYCKAPAHYMRAAA